MELQLNWVSALIKWQEPADDPRTATKDCLEKGKRDEPFMLGTKQCLEEKKVDEAAPTTESSSQCLAGVKFPHYGPVFCGASEFFDGIFYSEKNKSSLECSRRFLYEPDVTVVVSGVEFRHHGLMLCLSSGFFNEFLNSGTEQAKLKRVEIPDKDPEEWKRVAKFFEPVHSPNSGKFANDNIDLLLPWFVLLEMTHTLKAAEAWMLRKCQPPPGTEPVLLSRARTGHTERMPIEFLKSEVTELCKTFHTAVLYQFADLKKDRLDLLRTIVHKSPDLFTMGSINTLVSTLSCAEIDQETKAQLWMSLKVYIPPSALESPSNSICSAAALANPFLPHLIFMGMEVSALEPRKVRKGLLGRDREVSALEPQKDRKERARSRYLSSSPVSVSTCAV